MAGKHAAGDGMPANLAGMSKSQLYDIMCQMKTLIEQNQQQARQILIENPVLTRGLFQAQIMLGMVQLPQAVPSVQPAASQNLQSSTFPNAQSTMAPSSQGQVVVPDQARKQQQSQPLIHASSTSVPTNFPSQTMPLRSLQSVAQPKVQLGSQSASGMLPQSSQVPSMSPLPHHSAPQQPLHLLPSMAPASSQFQQSMQMSSIHQPLQPPLQPQPRAQIAAFGHQIHSPPNVGFQHPGAPQFHHLQPTFHPDTKAPGNTGPPFVQGPTSLPSHMPQQTLYQMGGGSHIGTEYNQVSSSVQPERPSPWIRGLSDNRAGTQLPGPPQSIGQMGPSNQPPRPPPLTPEVEKALLEKVMSLTPEQLNMLPPDQRNQVLQLQQMMRR